MQDLNKRGLNKSRRTKDNIQQHLTEVDGTTAHRKGDIRFLDNTLFSVLEECDY